MSVHLPKVRVLGVPDDYDPDETELRRVLTEKVRRLVEEELGLGTLPAVSTSRTARA